VLLDSQMPGQDGFEVRPRSRTRLFSGLKVTVVGKLSGLLRVYSFGCLLIYHCLGLEGDLKTAVKTTMGWRLDVFIAATSSFPCFLLVC
jgi:hypothetical protein